MIFFDSPDYSCFDIRYSGAGHPAHHPRVLLQLLIMFSYEMVDSAVCVRIRGK
jgi:hypothetical protein